MGCSIYSGLEMSQGKVVDRVLDKVHSSGNPVAISKVGDRQHNLGRLSLVRRSGNLREIDHKASRNLCCLPEVNHRDRVMGVIIADRWVICRDIAQL